MSKLDNYNSSNNIMTNFGENDNKPTSCSKRVKSDKLTKYYIDPDLFEEKKSHIRYTNYGLYKIEFFVVSIINNQKCHVYYESIFIKKIIFFIYVNDKWIVDRIEERKDNIYYYTELGKYNITFYHPDNATIKNITKYKNKIIRFQEIFNCNGELVSRCYYNKDGIMTKGEWYNNHGIMVKKFLRNPDNYEDS